MVASRPGCFAAVEISLVVTGLEAVWPLKLTRLVWRRENLLSLPGVEPRQSNTYPVAILTDLFRPKMAKCLDVRGYVQSSLH